MEVFTRVDRMGFGLPRAYMMEVYRWDTRNRSHGDVSDMWLRCPVSNSISRMNQWCLSACHLDVMMLTVPSTCSIGVPTVSDLVLVPTPRRQMVQANRKMTLATVTNKRLLLATISPQKLCDI